ncbi:MAG: hypothetical protein AB7P97_07765 [Hyphomonadaceae bacterium]
MVALLELAACNPQPVSYPPGVEMTFMNTCQAQGSSAELCGCVWERVESDVPADDFTALERLPEAEREAHPLMVQIRGYREACNVTLNPPVDTEEPVPAP